MLKTAVQRGSPNDSFWWAGEAWLEATEFLAASGGTGQVRLLGHTNSVVNTLTWLQRWAIAGFGARWLSVDRGEGRNG